MAKFNEKVLCLFHKDYKQLKKEAERRGMCHDGREKTIAKIIWKDAYDTGFTEGKNFATTLSNVVRNCCDNTTPEVKEYCLNDVDEGIIYRLTLTKEQVRAFNWLIDRGFTVQNIEFSEWTDSYEDVGRI